MKRRSFLAAVGATGSAVVTAGAVQAATAAAPEEKIQPENKNKEPVRQTYFGPLPTLGSGLTGPF